MLYHAETTEHANSTQKKPPDHWEMIQDLSAVR